MPNIVDNNHMQSRQIFKRLYSRYQQSRDLISVGAYVQGSDPETDLAIQKIDGLKNFLRQPLSKRVGFDEGLKELGVLFS